jgi:Tol biopolymer transport system component
MAELKEIFDMVTNKTEPDLDAWQQQERRQRRRGTGRRAAAFAVAAAVLAIAIVAIAALRDAPANQPAASTTPPPLVGVTGLVAYDAASGARSPSVQNVASFGAAISQDGQSIAFLRSVQGHDEIFVSAIDGTGAKQVTGLRGQPGCACGSFDPTWSPDGTQIAVSGTNDVGKRAIYVLHRTTGTVRRLTRETGTSFEMTPAWSPDGTQIAYARGDVQATPAGSGAVEVSALRPDGGQHQVVIEAPGATEPTWSPDGQLAYTAAVNGGTALFVTNLDGTAARRLTDGTGDAAAAWSPDGTQIAFVRGNEIALLTVASGEVRTLGTGGDPAWSPDGTTIYAWQTS